MQGDASLPRRTCVSWRGAPAAGGPWTRSCVLIRWLGSRGVSVCLSLRSVSLSAQALIRAQPTTCSLVSWAEARDTVKPRIRVGGDLSPWLLSFVLVQKLYRFVSRLSVLALMVSAFGVMLSPTESCVCMPLRVLLL